MIPLTRSTFWGPMAWAIMGGLSVATLLTLVVLPTLYAWAYRIRRDTPARVPAASVSDHADPHLAPQPA
jgi:multidrug efflux pump